MQVVNKLEMELRPLADNSATIPDKEHKWKEWYEDRHSRANSSPLEALAYSEFLLPVQAGAWL